MDTYSIHEIPLSECRFSHRVEDSNESSSADLELISRTIHPHKLHHLLFSLESPSLAPWNSSPYQKFSESIGIDMPTFYIHRHSVEDILSRFDQVHQSNVPVGLITLATNAFTYQHIPRLIQHFKTKNIPCVATEVYRAHPIKPGVILPVITDAMHTPISDAIADLNQTLNTCIDLENQYLAKVTKTSHLPLLNNIFMLYFLYQFANSIDIPVTDVCVGHVLVQNMPTFHFPEEFSYIQDTQVIKQAVNFDAF